MARLHLHPVKAAAVNGDDRALNVYQVVLAQIRCPFIGSSIAGLRLGTWDVGAGLSPEPA
jgi:hypothetical protein